jgi:hypothetical protein
VQFYLDQEFYEILIILFFKPAFRNLSERFDEEIPKRKTNCLSPATAGRVFVFPEFRSLTPPRADKQTNFC